MKITHPSPATRRPRFFRQGVLSALAFLLLLLPSSPASYAQGGDGQAPWPPSENGAPDESSPEAETSVNYEVTIDGFAPGEADLETLLRDSSRLIGLQDEPPTTEAGVRRRARDDVERFQQALRSEGFYDAKVSFEIVAPEANAANTSQAPPDDATGDTAAPGTRAGGPLQVRFTVDPGTVYLLARVNISYAPAIPESRAGIPRTAEQIGLDLGMRARAPEIQAAERRLLTQLENHGYPDANVRDRQAVIDRSATTMRVDWQVDPGPYTEFGEVQLSGLKTVEPKYVRSYRTWQTGETFDQRKIEEMRGELLETGLFDSIQIDRGDAAPDGQTPIQMTLEERAHRSIGFGARYSTSIGPSGTAFWEHRNYLGQDEDLRLELDAGLVEQSFTTTGRKPRWNRDDQDLLANFELRHKDSDSFEEYAAETGLAVEREFNDLWTGQLGGSIEALQTTDNEGTREFILYGVPSSLIRDSRDNPLNPTEGSRLSLDFTPYLSTVEAFQPFAKTSLGGSTYYSFDEEDRFVLAGRARVGTLVGAETEQVPASKRFYAGGGGSVRGFPYEEVGPLDEDDDPLGGRSLVELGLELRIKITDSIGIVPFLDAGQVYDTVYPDFSVDEPLRYGAGLGLRYYTAIGPVRFDVAVPLNKRDNDNDFEIYISLGQAF
ncbi:autotransporter assembly complex protein TamA [Rhodovibrio salinarum]|uniref:Outer membrane protein assembly factor n=1 Tax=Rhodovibrio salinarum TaxID=1087 RepID=A0A934QKN9_9PROT|nr:autotransporter assembly complex family protein [Rhodovibrio salinarum]MBK1698626.1 outer membrane protein assembly factor [Rhodovibrio salinarum]